MDKFDYYFRVLGRYDQYVQLANTKASNHITLLSSMLVAITAVTAWGISLKELNFCSAILAFLYLIFLFVSYSWYQCCMNVIQPDRSRNIGNTPHKAESDLSTIFYSDVSKFTDRESFKKQVYSRNADAELEDLLHQVFIMARVTENKFNSYEKINNKVKCAVFLGILILFISCVSQIGI